MARGRRVVAPRLDDFVEQMLASLRSYGQVVDAAIAEFGCDERTVTRAIARVREQWMKADASIVTERRAKLRAELEHAWRGALAAGDYRAIAMMARTRADIEGIKASNVVKHRHSGTIEHRPVPAMSPQERQREIDILLAKRAAELGAGTTLPLPAAIPLAAVAVNAVELPPDIRPVTRTPRKSSKRRRAARVH